MATLKKYGPLMTLHLGFKPTLVVSSAKMAKEVLKTHDLVFSNRPSLLCQQKLSYNGLDITFAPYNDHWRELRKICVLHLFNLKRVQSFRSIRKHEVSRTIKKIVASTSASKESKLINLGEITFSLTSAIICRIAFGRRYDDEGRERSRFHSLLDETMVLAGSNFVSDHFPFMSWVNKFTGMSSRLEKVFKELDLFYQAIIDDHLNEKRDNSGQGDIIDVLLHLKKDNTLAIDIKFDHIKAVLMDIFTAGTDTSAATTVWAMTGLMKNPRAMKRAQEEVRNIIRDKSFVDESDLQKLPYLKAVVKETLRLYCPVPLLVPRESTESCNINGYEIRPKTKVFVNAWAIGRDPESWENSEEFSPERFLGDSIDFYGKHFEFIPFGAGRRGCPGIHLGVVNIELALANLVYSFDWELPVGIKEEDIDIDVTPGLVFHKKNPLCLIPKKYFGHMDVQVI
ncbi:unnamed protein product [Ilex paraguariensis]|uniref:Cytochrome P450 n=1 Tax=Ilex paraguariensis TaxID=185542 RepID=A0ABC8QXQ5_9AQUA